MCFLLKMKRKTQCGRYGIAICGKWGERWGEIEREVVADLKVIEVTEHVCVEQVESIHSHRDKDVALKVFVAGLIHVIDTTTRVTRITVESGPTVVADTEILVFEHHHLGVIGVNQVAHST